MTLKSEIRLKRFLENHLSRGTWLILSKVLRQIQKPGSQRLFSSKMIRTWNNGVVQNIHRVSIFKRRKGLSMRWYTDDIDQPSWVIPYKVWNQCKRKVRHETKVRAEKVRGRMTNSLDLHSYFCENCFGWHLGHIEK